MREDPARAAELFSGWGAPATAPAVPKPVVEQAGLRLAEVDGILVPEAPSDRDNCGIDFEVLLNLALKLAYTSAQITTELTSRQLRLPFALAAEVLEQLRGEKLIEVLGEQGSLGYRFRITKPGRERGEWLMAISGYVGPAPVSLPAYCTMLLKQLPRLPDVKVPDVTAALSELVLSDISIEIVGLAASSGRSLFLYGPPGNGKTSLGRLMHAATRGEFWIPYCLAVESHVIRLFDQQCHIETTAALPRSVTHKYDQRWLRIRRPFVVVGGEVSLQDLDLRYDSERGYYEAPLHLKANGGTFLLDDFGCQRTPPNELLNRWIVPLENHVDYLTLTTGQQVQVPFRNTLVISTNLDPEKVIAPGLLRRMGYRLCVDDPTPEQYTLIFNRYAAQCGLEVPPGLLDWLLTRYQTEGRPHHGCEPRDLIERVRDICQFRGQPVRLDTDVMNRAWLGYFLNRAIEMPVTWVQSKP